ncbi:MAG: GAP family protein [Gallicola sp.]|nr:GAP family protein [Gallicola sp.]
MWALLLTTILTSAADSLNPFAITQQFVLQGMVRKPRDILYFIIPTGVTNMIGGFLAYFGLTALMGDFFEKLMESQGQAIYIMVFIVGIALLISAGFIVQKGNFENLQKEIHQLKSTDKMDTEARDLLEASKKVKSVSPIALILLGIGATISELMTALPYFAFLTVLFKYQLNLFQVTIILVIYNTIYTLPLVLLFILYIKTQDKFDRLYLLIKGLIVKGSKILAPSIIGIIGVVLIYQSLSYLLMMG